MEVVVGLLVLMGLLWFIYSEEPVLEPATEQQPDRAQQLPADELSDSISEQTANPAEKLPETNPFNAQTNPFEGAYENPFK